MSHTEATFTPQWPTPEWVAQGIIVPQYPWIDRVGEIYVEVNTRDGDEMVTAAEWYIAPNERTACFLAMARARDLREADPYRPYEIVVKVSEAVEVGGLSFTDEGHKGNPLRHRLIFKIQNYWPFDEDGYLYPSA